MSYFGLAETATVFRDLDRWIRRRLRAAVVKQWIRSCEARYHGVHRLGANDGEARMFAVSRKGPWAMANFRLVKIAMPNKFFAERGLFTLSGYEGKAVKPV
jgi:RNA-directed DNA polymerase